jgi:hypothetical protein
MLARINYVGNPKSFLIEHVFQIFLQLQRVWLLSDSLHFTLCTFFVNRHYKTPLFYSASVLCWPHPLFVPRPLMTSQTSDLLHDLINAFSNFCSNYRKNEHTPSDTNKLNDISLKDNFVGV